MSASSDAIASFAPEFVSDARTDAYLEQAASLLSVEFYGPQFTYACVLWMAHELTVADQTAAAIEDGSGSGTVGLVSSETSGRESKTYAVPSGNATTAQAAAIAWYQSTVYGRRLLALRGGVVAPARFAACG